MHTTGAMPCHTLALVQQLFGNGFKSWIVGELDKVRAECSPGAVYELRVIHAGLPLAGVADVRYWELESSNERRANRTEEL
jgi:hypothetical protein